MLMTTSPHIAWVNDRILAQGSPADVAASVKLYSEENPEASITIFDQNTSRTVDYDLRGSIDDVRARYSIDEEPATDPTTEPARRGRPKLGVEAREVTLLPRHWQWLNTQSGGASAALRKVVELAMRKNEEADRRRSMEESVYRFWTTLCGDRAGYEEACRKLFAHDYEGVHEQIADWPADIRQQTGALLERVG